MLITASSETGNSWEIFIRKVFQVCWK